MREDRDLRTYTRRGALGLMGAGGVFAATETFGFTDATRNRGLNLGVSTDDNAVLTITGTAKGGMGDEDTLDNFDSNSPATPPLDISFTNKTNAATTGDGFKLKITGGTIDDSSEFTKDDRTFTTTLSANGDSGDNATVTVDNDTGGTESITIEIVNVDLKNGASISLTRNNVTLDSPVTELTTSPDSPDVDSGKSLNIDVEAQDNQDGDDLSNIDITGNTTNSTSTNVDVTFNQDTRSTGDSSSVTFSPEFSYSKSSGSGDAEIEFSADEVSTTLTVTVNA